MDDFKSKPFIESPFAVRTATGETRNRATHHSHARELASAIWTTIEKPPFPLTDWKRQSVAALFISDPKIFTGFSPLSAVRRYAFPTGTKLRQQMRQFVQKSALDFFGAVVMQKRV